MDPLDQHLQNVLRTTPILDNSVWLFGCSYVWGSHVDSCHCISHCLSQKLGKPVANLGIRGASPKMILRLYDHLIERASPLGIAVLWPFITRKLIEYNDQFLHLGPWHFTQLDHPVWAYPDILAQYKKDLTSGAIMRENQQIIADWEKGRQSKRNYFSGIFKNCMLLGNINNLPLHPPNQFLDYARDDVHPGPLSLQAAAEHIFRQIAANWAL